MWRGDQVLHTKTFYWHHNTEICLLQSPWFISLTLKSDLWHNWHHLLCVCMLNKRFQLCDGVLRQTKHFLPCPVYGQHGRLLHDNLSFLLFQCLINQLNDLCLYQRWDEANRKWLLVWGWSEVGMFIIYVTCLTPAGVFRNTPYAVRWSFKPASGFNGKRDISNSQ